MEPLERLHHRGRFEGKIRRAEAMKIQGTWLESISLCRNLQVSSGKGGSQVKGEHWEYMLGIKLEPVRGER